MIRWDLFVGSALMSFCLSFLLAGWALGRAKPALRKNRQMPPQVGGSVVYITLAVTALAFFIFYGGSFTGKPEKLVGIGIAATLIFLLGLADDRKPLHYSVKIACEIFIISIVPFVGFELDFMTALGGERIALPAWFGQMVIVCWIILVMNAVNLIDGLDGLAAGVVAVASFTVFCLGFPNNSLIAAGALMLAAALAGILPFNFCPARIYLGDSGSLLIGFLIGVYSLFFQVKTYLAIAVFIPLLLLFVPLLNTGMVVWTRLRKGRNPFKGDIFHLHYRLLRQGLSHRLTVLFLWAVAASLCALVVLRQALPYRPRTVLFLFLVLVFYTALVQAFLALLKSRRHHAQAGSSLRG